MRGRLAILPYAVSAVLVLVLAFEWSGGGEPAPLKLAPARHAAVTADAPAAERDTSEWVDTALERPLFSANRRPAKVASGGGPAGTAAMPRLAGIMITPGGRRAIFSPEGGGKPLVLSEGGSVNDVAIRTIQPDRVVLASGAVLLPAYDKLRTPGTGMTTPFVPIAQPAFPQAGSPNPGFPGQPFPRIGGMANFPNQQPAPPPQPNTDDQDTPPTQSPVVAPQRRE